jgi:hypothetical protein
MSDVENPDLFGFRIFRRSPVFGDAAHQESNEVARLLRAAAHLIESGAPIALPAQRQLQSRDGIVVADFEFKPGMVRGANRERIAS